MPEIWKHLFHVVGYIIFWIWLGYCLYHNFHIRLGLDCWRGKRKFVYIKAKCHLREDDGKFEFWNLAIFKEPYKTYLKNHPYEFEQLVEILETRAENERIYFVAVDRKGEWDYSFRDKARISFATFHIEKDFILEQWPVRFSWKKFYLVY